MRKIQRDIVSALILSKDGKLFQGKKDPNSGGVYVNCWHIPGGGIEEGEEKESALVREIMEETGIDISSYEVELVDVSHGESEKTLKDSGEKVLCEMTFYDYRVTIDDKDSDEIVVSLDDDLAEYQWTNLDDLSSLELTPPSKKLFRKLGYLKDE